MHARRDGDAQTGAIAKREGHPAGTTASCGELEEARGRIYDLLASLLGRAPNQELLDTIASLRGDASPLGMARLALADAARETSAEAAGREHFNLFIGVGRGEILPYASFYLTGFLNERPLAEVRADLARLGIARREGVFEPEDHIATLFEIMAGLLQGRLGLEGVDAIAQSDAFFARHIAPWAMRLMEDIGAAPSARFYKTVASFASTWLAIDRQAMQLPG